EFLSGETLHRLAKRHDVCRNLIRIWVQKYEAGDFDEDAAAADLLQQYEARIAALERLVGKQALELEFLKGAVKSGPRPKNATTSVIVGPRVSASPKALSRELELAAGSQHDPVRVHAAVAARHVRKASSRKTRSVRRDVRWRWRLKVFWTAA